MGLGETGTAIVIDNVDNKEFLDFSKQKGEKLKGVFLNI